MGIGLPPLTTTGFTPYHAHEVSPSASVQGKGNRPRLETSERSLTPVSGRGKWSFAGVADAVDPLRSRADAPVDRDRRVELLLGAGAIAGGQQRPAPVVERVRLFPRAGVTAEDLDGCVEPCIGISEALFGGCDRRLRAQHLTGQTAPVFAGSHDLAASRQMNFRLRRVIHLARV